VSNLTNLSSVASNSNNNINLEKPIKTGPKPGLNMTQSTDMVRLPNLFELKSVQQIMKGGQTQKFLEKIYEISQYYLSLC
jgi:hypothetical protein